jgi:hypothetical protein
MIDDRENEVDSMKRKQVHLNPLPSASGESTGKTAP